MTQVLPGHLSVHIGLSFVFGGFGFRVGITLLDLMIVSTNKLGFKVFGFGGFAFEGFRFLVVRTLSLFGLQDLIQALH